MIFTIICIARLLYINTQSKSIRGNHKIVVFNGFVLTEETVLLQMHRPFIIHHTIHRRTQFLSLSKFMGEHHSLAIAAQYDIISSVHRILFSGSQDFHF